MGLEMTVELGDNKRVDAGLRGFTIRTDQSVKAGGDASAPEPFMLFLASIGTCAGFYVQSFCNARKIGTDGVRIVQRMEWDAKGRKLTDLHIDIHVPPDFPDKYHAAVIRAADQCAVKKTILAPPNMHVTTVVDR